MGYNDIEDVDRREGPPVNGFVLGLVSRTNYHDQWSGPVGGWRVGESVGAEQLASALLFIEPGGSTQSLIFRTHTFAGLYHVWVMQFRPLVTVNPSLHHRAGSIAAVSYA